MIKDNIGMLIGYFEGNLCMGDFTHDLGAGVPQI